MTCLAFGWWCVVRRAAPAGRSVDEAFARAASAIMADNAIAPKPVEQVLSNSRRENRDLFSTESCLALMSGMSLISTTF